MSARAAAADRLFVVLTVRGVASSKSRLRPALDDAERTALNRRLVERTLAVIGEWLGGLQRCVVVSACEETLALASGAGALALVEPGGAQGHNHAAAVGAASARAFGAGKVMMLPADLPDLSAGALQRYAAHADRAQLVLAPDKAGTGTNSLIAPATADLRFFFGDGSLARYVQWAAGRGWRIALHADGALAFDLDTPADYAQWRARVAADARSHERAGAMV